MPRRQAISHRSIGSILDRGERVRSAPHVWLLPLRGWPRIGLRPVAGGRADLHDPCADGCCA